MLMNYCGKICADCTEKEVLCCPGCSAGPGNSHVGDCELARCCREKGHETCETCSFHTGCGLLRSAGSMPMIRKRKLELDAAKKAAASKDAVVLGKWLWILFWLIIVNSIIALISNDFVAERNPDLYFIGEILSAVSHAAYGFILLQLVQQDEMYKKAGILFLVTAAAGAVITLISGPGEAPGWTAVISLPASIALFVAEYYKFMAHASVLKNVNQELSQKWIRLWGWYIKCYIAVIAAVVITLIVPVIGLIVIAVAAIGMAVAAILEIVYLYRTVRAFREYTPGAFSL